MTKRLKVLFLTIWYPDSNPVSGIFVKRHAEAVSKTCDITVLYAVRDPTIQKIKKTSQIEDGIRVYRLYLPLDLSSNFSVINNLRNNVYIHMFMVYRKIVTEIGFHDIVQVNVMSNHLINMGLFAILLKFLFGIPFVIVEHSATRLNPPSGVKETIKTRLTLKFAGIVLPVSTILKNALESVQSANYQIIGNVVDTTFFVPKKIEKHNLKKRILHVSLLNDRYKNVSGIIRAVGYLRNIRSDFELHIVGDGLDKEPLMELAHHIQGQDEYIFFHGLLLNDLLLSEFQKADLFVLNSNLETFGCVVIEAISCGCPVISTRCGGPEDIITEENGILVDVGNDDQLCNAMNYCLDNLSSYEPQKMHEYVNKKYGFDSIGVQFRDVYNEALKTKT